MRRLCQVDAVYERRHRPMSGRARSLWTGWQFNRIVSRRLKVIPSINYLGDSLTILWAKSLKFRLSKKSNWIATQCVKKAKADPRGLFCKRCNDHVEVSTNVVLTRIRYISYCNCTFTGYYFMVLRSRNCILEYHLDGKRKDVEMEEEEVKKDSPASPPGTPPNTPPECGSPNPGEVDSTK